MYLRTYVVLKPLDGSTHHQLLKCFKLLLAWLKKEITKTMMILYNGGKTEFITSIF